MALATLSIDIVAKLASLEANLDKATRLSEKSAATIDARWSKLQGTFQGLGAAVGGAFAVREIAAFIDRTVDGLDKLNDVADVTGSTVENLSALEDTAIRTGGGIDVVEGSLVKFNAVLKEADGKNGVSQALKAIGLDAQALRKEDPAEALRLTAVALAGFADDGDKARLVQELFGKSVKEVGPFLKDLAEQGKLNATVTTEQAKQAEALNKQLFNLQKNVVDVARDIGSVLIPVLNRWAEAVGAIPEVKALGNTRREALALNAELSRAGDMVGMLAGALEADPGNAGLAKRLEEARAKLEALQRQAAQTSEALKGSADKLAPIASAATGDFSRSDRAAGVGKLPEPPKAQSSGPSDVQRYLDNLDRQLEKTLELTVYEQALLDIQEKRIKKVTPAEEEEILRKARLVDENKRLIDARTADIDAQTKLGKATAERIAEIEKGNEAMRREIELIGLDAYGLSAIEKARIRSIRTLKEEERARRIANGAADETLQSLDAEIDALKEREDLIQQRAARTFDEENKQVALDSNSDFTRRAAENIQDTLSGQLYKVYKGDFDNILDAWGDLLLKMVAEAQAAQLNKALFGKTVGGEGEGILGQLIKAGIQYFTAPSVGPGSNANGFNGTLNNPSAYVEIPQAAAGIDRVPYDGFIAQLHKDEKVVPAKYRDGGGSAAPMQVIINNTAANDTAVTATQRTGAGGGQQLELTVKRIARQAVVEDIGSGGTIDAAMRKTYGVGRQTTRRS